MKRLLHIFLCVIAIMGTTGCSSLSMRFHKDDPGNSANGVSPIREPQYVYPGTQGDLRGLAIPFWTSGDAIYDGMTMMFYPFVLIDLPFSLVADTIFIPYDVYMVTLGGKTRYRGDIRENSQPPVRGDSVTRAKNGTAPGTLQP